MNTEELLAVLKRMTQNNKELKEYFGKKGQYKDAYDYDFKASILDQVILLMTNENYFDEMKKIYLKDGE